MEKYVFVVFESNMWDHRKPYYNEVGNYDVHVDFFSLNNLWIRRNSIDLTF